MKDAVTRITFCDLIFPAARGRAGDRRGEFAVNSEIKSGSCTTDAAATQARKMLVASMHARRMM